MKLNKLFLMLTFLVLLGTTAFAQTTYYVNGLTGNDSWTGTASTFQSGNVGPKKTIQAMLNDANVVDGDIISIAAGTYNETVTLTKRVQLSPSGAVTVNDLILNTNSSTATTVGNNTNNLTISGTLSVVSGKYNLTTANVILASGGTLDVKVDKTSSRGLQSPITTTAGNFTLTFSNTSAITYTPTDLYTNNPGNVNFNGSATVTLGAAVTVVGDLTIASGASVNLAGYNIEVKGGDFTNNGSYSCTGTEKVQMTTAGGIISGSGTFQNLQLNQNAQTWTLGSDLNFNNVSQSTASLIDVNDGAINLDVFNITTPGSFTYSASADGFSATTGKLIFTGTTGTIGTVNFTLGQNVTVPNLKIDKPSGSIVAVPTAGNTLTVSKQFEFLGGIFNLNNNNLTLSNSHGATAAIGGNLNGTGNFTLGGGSLANDITISGAGQINTPFTVDANPKTVTFTQLTTIGNSLTMTSGTMVTNSLQLINGSVTLNNSSILTLNTTNVSITNTLAINNTAQLKGTSNITVSGNISVATGAKIDKTAGTVSAAGTVTLNGSAVFKAAGLTTTVAGGNVTINSGNFDIISGGSLNSAGNISVAGSAVINVAGDFTAATTINLGSGAVTIGGNVSAGGNFTMGAGNVTVGGNFTTTSSGSLLGSTGTLTVSGTGTIAGSISYGGGDIAFNGTGTSTVGNGITSTADDGTATLASPSIKFSGPLSLTGNIAPLHNMYFVFNGAVTGASSDLVLTVAGKSVTVDFNSSANLRDLLFDTDITSATVNFNASTSLPVSQIRNISVAAGAANPVNINVNSASATSYHTLKISGDITTEALGGGINSFAVGTNARVVFNGSGDLKTYANAQKIDLSGGALAIDNVEIANTGTDSNTSTDDGGDGGTTDERLESVYITGGNTLTVKKLWLTSNGINGTNLTIGNDGTITRSAGSINVANPTFGTTVNLVYTNSSDITTGLEYTVPAGSNKINNLSLSGTGGKVTLTANSGNILGALTVDANRELAMTNGSNNYTVTISNSTPGTVATINGTVSGNNPLTVMMNAANGTYTVTGSGTVNNFTASTFDNASDVLNFSIANVTGNITTTGSNGTFALTSGGPSTIGGNLTVDNATVTLAKNLTVNGNISVTVSTAFNAGTNTITTAGTITKAGAGSWTSGAVTMTGANKNFTQTAGDITISGNLTVTGNYTQSAGNLTLTNNGVGSIAGNMTWAQNNLTLSVAGDFTVNGSFTGFGSGAGQIIFPAASTSSFYIKGSPNTIKGSNATFTFNTGSGRVSFNGTAAQTLTITGGSLTIDRVELNNPAGLNVSGVGVNWAIKNLLLTAGNLTHNGLLNMSGATDRIVRNLGTLSSFPATGPAEVEYISTSNLTTSYELPSTLNKLIINATSGNPSYTLDKNVTVLSGGELNLSRGTLVIGSNTLIVQNNSTITRAEGFLTGAPTYGTGETLQYFNTESDITTGPEFTNDGSVTSLVVNAPNKQVILGSNVTVAGNVNVNFGTINLNGYTLTVSSAATLTNNGNITGTGTLKNTGAGTIFTGTATSWPNIVSTNNLTINPTNASTDITLASLSQTAGNFTVGGNVGTLTINGDFSNAGTGTFNDNGKTINFKGNVTIGLAAGGTLTNNGTFVLNGTSAQTLSSTKPINNLTINNNAGVSLASNIIIANAGTLTLTKGLVTTGSYYVQLGTTAVATAVRPANGGMIVGNVYKWVDSQPGTGVTVSHLFPVGTSDGKYRPVTLEFTGTAAGPVGIIVKVNHTNTAPAGTVGIPFTTGGITINKLSPLYWTVGMYDPANPTVLKTPATNPKVTLGVGGFSYGDITKIRGVYRLTNDANTWQEPGTYVNSYYSIDGVATVIYSGVQGWSLEPQQLFTIGYQSNLVVANPIADQTLTVGGTPFTKNIQAAPAVFSGNVGALTFAVNSSDVNVATAAINAGVLTVTPVAAGTSTITLTATDVNGDHVTDEFVVTVNAYPQFTAPAITTVTMNEGQDSVITFTATGQGTITLSKVSGPSYASFNASNGNLTLNPGYSDAGSDSVVIRATSSNGLFTDKKLYITVVNVNQTPVFITVLSDTTLKYGQTLSFTYNANDADGEAVVYSVVSSPALSSGSQLSISPSLGGLQFSVVFADVNKEFTLTVKAIDPHGAYAETSAKVKFVPNLAKGDLNGSGLPDATDASDILKHVVGLTPITDPEKLYAADVNGDGEIGAYDAAWILYYVANGSWPSAKISAAMGNVEFERASSEKGVISLPLTLKKTSGVVSVYTEVQLTDAVEFKGVSTSLPEGWVAYSNFANGVLKIAMAGTTPLKDGNVALINLGLKDKEAQVNLNASAKLNDQSFGMMSVKVKEIPAEFSISQNYPNPFNPTTSIKYAIPQDARVSLVVYDMLGQVVKTLVDQEQEAGYYTVRWDGTNNFGSKVSSGIYIYRIVAGKYTSTMKMNLLK